MAAIIRVDLSGVRQAVERAAVKTMEALRTEVVKAQVMPFDSGDMQGNNTFVPQAMDSGDTISAMLTTDAPQARRLYYHPEYNFQQIKNANAGGMWLDEWISGSKKNFVEDTFRELLKKELEK